jgi:hypothetical protein
MKKEESIFRIVIWCLILWTILFVILLLGTYIN